jgi:hypothetical protein
MTEDLDAPITADEVIAFGRRVDEWATTLTDTERAILTDMLTEAAGPDADDTSGYLVIRTPRASGAVTGEEPEPERVRLPFDLNPAGTLAVRAVWATFDLARRGR